MEERKYKVYMHISPSGKKYIGITKQSLKKRFDNGRGYKGCFRFKKAIDKYGWENIEHILLKDNLTEEEAKKMEIDLIKKHKTTDNRFGYNCSIGGNVPFITEETIRKRSLASKGRIFSDETKRKISMANKGRVFSEQSRKRMSESHKGKKLPTETIEKMSKSHMGRKCSKEWIENANKRKYKKVDMYDLSGNYIKTFDSITEACSFSGAKAGNITKCIKEIRNTCAGYVWKLHCEDIVSC